MLKRTSSTRMASGSVGISGTRMSRIFEGKCVATIVLIKPNREASRDATNADIPTLHALIESSVRILQANDYTPAQIEGALGTVLGLDTQLLADQTYFVAETTDNSGAKTIVACGGWSKRAKLYSGSGDAEGDDRLLDPATDAAHVRAMFTRSDWTRRGLGRRILEACEAAARAEGFRRLMLGATLPGVPLYEAFGFRSTGRDDVTMPDGVALACVWMDKPID